MSAIEDRLRERGLDLPPAPPPAANYVPFVISGKWVLVSGQLPMQGGGVAVTGKLGRDLTVEDGQAAARLCALNALAQAKAACEGDLERLGRCLKLGGFVNAAPEFTDHPKVINGASDLIAEVMQDAGRHARFAVGCASLPLDAAVEVEAIFELA